MLLLAEISVQSHLIRILARVPWIKIRVNYGKKEKRADSALSSLGIVALCESAQKRNRSDMTVTSLSHAWFRQGRPKPASSVLSSEK